MPLLLSETIVSGVSGRPGGGGTLLRKAVKMAVGSNGIRPGVVAPDLTMSEDGFGGTSERRVSNWVERGGVWTCARFERDRREWESEARTMAYA